MFKVNDVVKYGANGVCRVVDISVMTFGDNDAEYYILQPLRARESKYYVPTQSETLVARMQMILSEDDVYALIKDIPSCSFGWVDNDKKRLETYSAVISSGNRHDIIGVIRTLYGKKCDLEKSGKRLHVADERLMKDAERIIHDEFAAVLNIEISEVGAFIAQNLEQS